ncbi:MAG: carbohydrate binding domain-containing protein [Marinilabiliaceae bacterium]|nr:carbohydrate binding domain-containing protein [Marinilabiliaceae bacterium]
MKKTLLTIGLILSFFPINLIANEPDSAYIIAYSKQVGRERGGLQFAWSLDKKNWHTIGDNHKFMYSDFGSWGGQKKMFDPYLFLDNNGKWHCVWHLNKNIPQFAHAASDNLSFWWRQSYPYVMESGSCLMPEISYEKANDKYLITWFNDKSDVPQYLKVYTSDFKTFSKTEICSENERINNREKVIINGIEQKGVIQFVSWKLINGLIKEMQLAEYKKTLHNQRMEDDPIRFSDLKTIDVAIKVDSLNSKSISNLLIGIFFEDINYAADGGLYAELIQNRDFEYSNNDRKEWNNLSYWQIIGNNNNVTIQTENPIHKNNPNYAVLNIDSVGMGIINEGFDGIAINKGEKYDFSVFVKSFDGKKNNLQILLVDVNNNIVGNSSIKITNNSWKKLTTQIIAKETISNAKLKIIPQNRGIVGLDMISLFPVNTFKNRKNGLRADLAQCIADINPKFVRFPGGCVAHGNGLENMYRWKNTVGSLESRVPQRNIWRYHQSAGLGYFEYFQFCEDIGAEPLPVLAAGVPCQNSSIGGHGQQGGIPMCDMDNYIQEVLDLIEWANGDKNSKWGKIRAEAGHPKPFNLKYIGIGNEDLITNVFEDRFTMIFNAVREKYPEIKVVGTVGPFYEGTDYEEGWNIGTKLGVDILDEHYYVPPGWFIYNQDYYDRYDRNEPKVYLGEYASHLPQRQLNIETALSEALYLTSVERNGDIVEMTSYAPLLARERNTQWNPDLIYFNNTEVKPTVDYYVQLLYGQNSGDLYIPSSIKLSNNQFEVKNRFASSVVKNSKTNELIIKLVNMLPVEINTTIDLSGYQVKSQQVPCIVLSGDPKDRHAKPETTQTDIAERFDYKMVPYSFSVIRIPIEKE